MQITFTISDGQIINPKMLGDFFRAHSEGTYLLTSKATKIRTVQQNRYWWGYLVPTCRHGLNSIGFDDIKNDQQCHDLLKGLFFKKSVTNVNTGEVIEFAGSTAECSTVDFAERIAEVQKWASEYLSIVILDPGQSLQIDYPTEPLPQY